MIDIREEADGVVFGVRVSPRAKRNAIGGEHDGLLKIGLTAPPVDGAANAALIKLLSKTLGVSKSSVTIVSGQSSRTKRVRVTGITQAQILALVS